MSLLRIDRFFGLAPRIGKKKLAANMAQIANNVELFSKEIRPTRTPLKVAYPTKVGVVQSIFPLGGKWLHWTTDVDVVRAPLSTGQDGRIYYTGDGNPRSTDTTLATVGSGTDYPLASYRLGLRHPETAPTVGITGGSSGVPETRSYVYTWVTAWGEEGPPSDPTEYAAAHNDATSWDLTSLDAYPLNTGSISNATYSSGVVTVTVTANHHLMTGDWVTIASVTGMTDLNGRRQVTRLSATTFSVSLTTAQSYTSGGTWTREALIQTTGMVKRIYRTQSGVFKYVGQTTAGATSFTDTVASSALGETIPTTTWTSPPPDMKGIIELPNGILAGFFDNVLCFSVPYKPHAWPTGYQLTFGDEIVGIRAFGNNIVVGTKGHPYMVSGTSPEGMSSAKMDIFQACVSKRGMVALVNGVIYPSPDGLVYVTAGNLPQLITEPWMKKDEWTLYAPTSFHAAVVDDRYMAFYSNGGAGQNESGGLVFDPADQETTLQTIGMTATASYSDLETDSLYLYTDGAIQAWKGGSSYLAFQWKSKEFITPRPICFKAAVVRFTVGQGFTEAQREEAIAAQVAAVDASMYAGGVLASTGAFGGFSPAQYPVAGGPYLQAINELGISVTANFKIFADGDLVFEKNLDSPKPFRLPGGYLAESWEVQVSGTNISVHEIMLAETMSELAAA